MKHRVFIAINLPEGVKTALSKYQNKWQKLPVKWTKSENLHITLVFIGDVDEGKILKIKQAINKVIVRYKSFPIVFDKTLYSPHKKDKEIPKMIWVKGQLSKDFLNLKKDLEKELTRKIGFSSENRPACRQSRETVLHITLARIKEWEWRIIEPDERPEIEEDINFKITAESIELMESVLKRSGSEYTILESFPLD